VESSGSRAHCKCGALRRSQCAMQQEELPEAQRAARRGRSPSSGRWARCGRRVRSAQTAGDAKRKQGEDPESERCSTRRNTNKAGTGPPRCLDNCANNRSHTHDKNKVTDRQAARTKTHTHTNTRTQNVAACGGSRPVRSNRRVCVTYPSGTVIDRDNRWERLSESVWLCAVSAYAVSVYAVCVCN